MTLSESEHDALWAAQQDFYMKEHPRLLAYLRRRLPDRNTAEDVAHEVWTAFMARWERERPAFVQSPKLLFRIAHCQYANWWRAHGSNAPELHADLVELTESLSRIGTGELTDLRIDLARALTGLTPQQLKAIHLHYLDDLPMSLVGDQLGITERGARKAVATALTVLRDSAHLIGYRSRAASREVL